MIATRRCSTPRPLFARADEEGGCPNLTSRADGVCDDCWKARQQIEVSLGQVTLVKIVLAAEADWRLDDRIEWSVGAEVRIEQARKRQLSGEGGDGG